MSPKKRLSNKKQKRSSEPSTSQSANLSPKPQAADPSVPLEDINIIDTLPNETILLILSNLSHGDVLWARLVCKKWNEIITTDRPFLRRSTIRICENSEDRKNRTNILMDSPVKWRSLNLKNLKTEGIGRALPIEVPIFMGKEIQRLKISYGKLSWKGFQQILIQFPALKELKISHSEILYSTSLKERNKVIPATSLQSEFEAVLNGIDSLIISRCEIPSIIIFLSRFQKHMKSLSTFVIRDDTFCPFLIRRYGTDLCQGLFEFIEGTSGTLQTLGIAIIEPEVVKNLLGKVIQKLNDSPTASTNLNLLYFCIRIDLIGDEDHSPKDLQSLLQFLEINKNLKKIYALPEHCPQNMVSKFLAAVPANILELEFPGTSYFSTTPTGCVFNKFKELEHIFIHEHVRASQLRLELEAVAMPGIKTFATPLIKYWADVKLVTDSFPNLVHLKMTINARASTEIFHHICDNLKLLVSLDLSFGKRCEVTDYTITRIPPSFCLLMQENDSLSTLPAYILPFVNKNPLASLKRLEKLVMEFRKMHMTNVGLSFGFRFACLKQLSLSNTGTRSSITPAGLHYFADFNRGLERISFHRMVSTEGPLHDSLTTQIEQFKLRMDRCKDFRIKVTGCDDSNLHSGVHLPASSSSDSSDDTDSSDSSSTSSNDSFNSDSSDDSFLGLDILFHGDSESDDSSDDSDGDDNDGNLNFP